MNASATPRLPDIRLSAGDSGLDYQSWVEVESWARANDAVYRAGSELIDLWQLDDLDGLRFLVHQLLRAKVALEGELATRPPRLTAQTVAPAPAKEGSSKA